MLLRSLIIILTPFLLYVGKSLASEAPELEALQKRLLLLEKEILDLKMKNIVGNLNFYDPYVPSGYEKVLGANRFNSLENMLENSQIISFHVPLTKETKGMINRSFINKMQENSILINTSRGGIIDSLDCLYNGLSSGKLSSGLYSKISPG